MKKLLPLLAATSLLAACTTNDDVVTAKELQHHRWELVSIDGNEVAGNKGQVSDLEIGESMFANGFAGCNTFRGKAEINQETGQFRINQMAMTMKMCPGAAMYTERSVASTLSAWSDLEYSKDSLVIKNDTHTLVYTLKDRML